VQRVLLQLLKPEQLVVLIPHPLELLSMLVLVQLILQQVHPAHTLLLTVLLSVHAAILQLLQYP
jgi:hypothetical protein